MSKSKLTYVETTIPSFYYNTRKDDANLARQRWTQKWWDECVQKQNVVTSYAVIQELEDSGYVPQNIFNPEGGCIRSAESARGLAHSKTLRAIRAST